MKKSKFVLMILSAALCMAGTPGALAQQGREADLSKADSWLNSPALTPADLHGKVVLVEFWTFECYNCRNTLPYVKKWAQKYKDQGLVVIGVHSPELPAERNPANVAREVKSLGIEYPVAIDSKMRIWDSFHNEFWPAFYLFDAQGKMRAFHAGEDEDQGLEKKIQELVRERDQASVSK